MVTPIKSIAVFCGSRLGNDQSYDIMARVLGTYLAQHGIQLVYGGGNVGLMGIVANAALAAGGEVIGVITKDLQEREVAHTGLSRIHVVDTMHLRKAIMAELADAFIALPGGFGTMEEVFEIVTWAQLGLHQKPIGLLDVNGFYWSLIEFLQHTSHEGFIAPDELPILLHGTSPATLLEAFLTYTPPIHPKVLERIQA